MSRLCPECVDKRGVRADQRWSEEGTARQNAGTKYSTFEFDSDSKSCFTVKTLIFNAMYYLAGCADEAGGGSEDRGDPHPGHRHGAAHQDPGPGRRGGGGDDSLEYI